MRKPKEKQASASALAGAENPVTKCAVANLSVVRPVAGELRSLTKSETHAASSQAGHSAPDDEKRNPTPGEPASETVTGVDAQGVGGRQALPRPSAGGGGYLSSCTGANFEFSRDALLMIELRRMGLPDIWLTVAEAIGAENFLAMWRIVSERSKWHDVGTVRVFMPQYASYLRYQRNRLIEEMAREGAGVVEISERVTRELGERVSTRRLYYLRQQARK